MIEEDFVATKHVDDVLVACLRFRSQYDEIPQHFDVLRAQVRPYISGKGLILYYGPHPDGGADMEVCFPVSRAVVTDQVQSRVLPGGDVLSVVHHGPYATLGKTWEKLFDYIERHNIPVKGPRREIYLQFTGDDARQYITELQVPLANRVPELPT